MYEEELDLRDGFRWSPDSKQIAYWQFDTTGVEDLAHQQHRTLYPVAHAIPYPKAGKTNSAARVGVVDANGGPTRWIEMPGDPRNNYLPRMEWSEDGRTIAVSPLGFEPRTKG